MQTSVFLDKYGLATKNQGTPCCYLHNVLYFNVFRGFIL